MNNIIDITPIRNSTELQLQIMHLNARREQQEEDIKHNVKEIYYSLHPSEIIKNAFGDLSSDPGSRQTLTKSGLQLGADFILNKIFGRSVKGYIASLVLGKVSDYLINNKSDLITAGIGAGISKLKGLFSKHERHVES